MQKFRVLGYGKPNGKSWSSFQVVDTYAETEQHAKQVWLDQYVLSNGEKLQVVPLGTGRPDRYLDSFKAFGSSLAEILSEADNAGSAQVWRELAAKLHAAHDYVLGKDNYGNPDSGDVGHIVCKQLVIAREVSTSAVAHVSKTLSLLRQYAGNKAHACRLRESGKIETAQRCEQAADAIYNELDPSVRW